jgi:adenine-specific DNA methylase
MYSNLAQELFNNLPICNRGNFPSTRYQGSKNKIVKWTDYCTKDLKFNSVIDAFGGTGVNYIDFYHFLEGIVLYDQWENLIDEKSQHKKIKNMKNVWCRAKDIQNAFDIIFEKFKDSIIVLSYRDDGIPTIDNLIQMLSKYKKEIEVHKLGCKYVLSNKFSKEVLIIAQ